MQLTIDINESIQVAMIFRGDDVHPAAFTWNGRRHDVARILLVHKTRVGDVLRWHFTLETTGGGVARLAFDTLSLHWQLEEFQTV